MKILQICYKPPFPPVDGGTLAMNSITKGLLSAGHSVKILSLSSNKHPLLADKADPAFLQKTRFESVQIDLSIHPLDAALSLLCGESYNIKRFDNANFHSLIAITLKEETFDIIHVESLFLTPYLTTIRRNSNAPVVLRAHNVEYRIWQQMALRLRPSAKRWYIKKLAFALRLYELQHINDYDGIVCITDNDADTYISEGCRRPIVAIPFGISITATTPTNTASNIPSLYHLGAMDWQPNVDAIEWFLSEVWPQLKKQVPQLQFFLAGRKMPQRFLDLHIDGVTVLGEVPDATEFIRSKQINIVPLHTGSGLRIKIIEAMALGKAVVATTTAVQGIHCNDGKELLIADTAQQFVEQIKRCIDNPDLCNTIGNNAYRFACQNYSIDSTTAKLVDFYNIIIEKTLA